MMSDDLRSFERYAATMEAYALTLSSLLARLDGCPPVATPAADGAVEPVICRPSSNQGDRS
jgi:hypothetical protein